MSVFYLDASAWVKRYVQERGSDRVHTLFDRGERIACATLGYVETVAALSRRVSDPDWARIAPQLQADWRGMMHLPSSDEAMSRAADLAHRYRLRGADAVHLATALDLHRVLVEIREPTVFVASDGDLLIAAQAAGLAAENPAHPKSS